MPKLNVMPSAAIVLAAMVLLPPLGDGEVRAQSAPLYISAVDLEIAPASASKFLAALKGDGAAMMQEPNAREFDSAVRQKDANHVFVFEVYNNAAAYDAHQKTVAYGKFLGTTMFMIKNYNIRPFSSVIMDTNASAQAESGPFFVNQVELDIVPAKFDAFMAAAEDNAAAAVKDSGVREFNITVSQKDPHHILQFEVYDNAAAHDAHVATDHFKAYQAATKDMVAKHQVTQLTSVQMLAKQQ